MSTAAPITGFGPTPDANEFAIAAHYAKRAKEWRHDAAQIKAGNNRLGLPATTCERLARMCEERVRTLAFHAERSGGLDAASRLARAHITAARMRDLQLSQ